MYSEIKIATKHTFMTVAAYRSPDSNPIVSVEKPQNSKLLEKQSGDINLNLIHDSEVIIIYLNVLIEYAYLYTINDPTPVQCSSTCIDRNFMET